MSKVTTFLWFSARAHEAARFYVSVFTGAGVAAHVHGHETPDAHSQSATFTLDGQTFIAFNGGPHFALSPAVSMYVDCATQVEVDYFWDKLIEGGKPSRCGWLQDQFGLSWQIIPSCLPKLLSDPDRSKAERVIKAMLTMVKLDVAALERAASGAPEN